MLYNKNDKYRNKVQFQGACVFMNSLLKDNAELMKEYNYAKNSGLDLAKITTGSDKKIWWKCALGHEWEASISSRKSGSGCPYCSNQKIMSGYNDLATINPKLAAEWNYEKNGELLPSMIAPNSNRKVWWKCKKGHEWQNAPGRRKNNGCPFCSNQRILPGYNDLATINPRLAAEWNYEKNGDLLPSMIAPKSNRKVWWKCKKGHEWQNTPSRRKKNGCPFCSNQLLLSGYNDIATTNPEALSEWDFEKNIGVDPRNLQAGSEKKVWWKCPRGHSYQMQIDLKVKYGHKCPVCSKGRHVSFPEKAVAFYFQRVDSSIIEGFSDDRLQISELDVFSPQKHVGIEYDGNRWHSRRNTIKRDVIKNEKCKEAGITLYRIREDGCRPIENSSSVDYYYDPKDLSALENIIKSLISTIYNVDSTVDIENDRISIYKMIDIWFERNSAALLSAEALAEWDYEKNQGLEPGNFSANTHKKVWWTCTKCGGSWQTSIANRNKNCGCPFCTGHRLLSGYNDLSTVAPELLKEWDYKKNTILPSSITAHSAQKVWWKCEYGHSYSARVSNRVDLGRGCPICANKTIIEGVNDLATTNPELLADWDYSKNKIHPTEISAGSPKKIWWKCSKCGNEWQTSPNSRTNNKSGCSRCAEARKGQSQRKKVQQCSENGIIIRTYFSIKEAAQAVNRCPSAIVNACKGKVNTCAGYVWKYIENE